MLKKKPVKINLHFKIPVFMLKFSVLFKNSVFIFGHNFSFFATICSIFTLLICTVQPQPDNELLEQGVKSTILVLIFICLCNAPSSNL